MPTTKPKPAAVDSVLRCLIADVEDLLERHLDVLDHKPDPVTDHEVFDIQETIRDAKEALANPRLCKF